MNILLNSDDQKNIENSKKILKKFVAYQSNNKNNFIASKKAFARYDYNGPLVGDY